MEIGNLEAPQIPRHTRERISLYIEALLDENQRVNLISRQLTRTDIRRLIDESLMIRSLIDCSFIADAGSGGGLLAVPLAMADPEKTIIAIETRRKKVASLRNFIDALQVNNLSVYHGSFREWAHTSGGEGQHTIVARGFPSISELALVSRRSWISELIVISSREKIKKLAQSLESHRKTIYNIPYRDQLVVIKLENVSRET